MTKEQMHAHRICENAEKALTERRAEEAQLERLCTLFYKRLDRARAKSTAAYLKYMTAHAASVATYGKDRG